MYMYNSSIDLAELRKTLVKMAESKLLISAVPIRSQRNVNHKSMEGVVKKITLLWLVRAEYVKLMFTLNTCLPLLLTPPFSRKKIVIQYSVL